MGANDKLSEWAPGVAGAMQRTSEFLAAVPGSLWVCLYALWLIGSIIYLLMERRTPAATLAWVIGFVSLPVVSAVVYFFFGPRKLKRRKLRRALARQLTQEATPDGTGGLPTRFEEESGFAGLARVAVSRGDPCPMTAQSVVLYDNGDETYEAIEEAMRLATLHIHLEYYIFEPDAIGARWRDILVTKARQGVQVRVLVDALGSQSCPPAWWRPLTEAGGQIRYFNPPRILKLRPGRLNFRTHRKIVVIDGSTGFTGGINVCKQNSRQQCGLNAWRDTHMQMRGAPVSGLQTVFLEDWIFAADRDTTWLITNRALADIPDDIQDWYPRPANGNGPWIQIVDSGPDETFADIHRFFFSAITCAKKRVWITTPYFVPDESILTAITTATARGLDVRLLIPLQGDSRFVTAAASTFAGQVAREGTSVWTFGPGMNHAKTVVVDDELAIVGTANMDNRSFRLNFEVVAAIYDREVNAQLAGMFEADLKYATRLIPGENDGNFLHRLLASGARLFAPLL